MSDPGLIIPRRTFWETCLAFSPQVKAALIGAAVSIVLAGAALVWQVTVYRGENSLLRAEVHDKESDIRKLENELSPFRNLAVQEFSLDSAGPASQALPG